MRRKIELADGIARKEICRIDKNTCTGDEPRKRAVCTSQNVPARLQKDNPKRFGFRVEIEKTGGYCKI